METRLHPGTLESPNAPRRNLWVWIIGIVAIVLIIGIIAVVRTYVLIAQ